MSCIPPRSIANEPSPVTRSEALPTEVDRFLARVTAWATDQPLITAILLVGSYARGAARQDSDIDLILLADSPETYTSNTEWATTFGTPDRMAEEDWGKVTSLRVWYRGGPEVEFGVADTDWGADPSDRGDAQVVGSGYRILYDATGALDLRLQRLCIG